MSKTIDLVALTSLDTEKQLKIREIRNEPAIRAVMFTDHVIEVSEHLQWLARLKQDKTRIVFAILDSNTVPLGTAAIQNIDLQHKKADWGIFLTETEWGGLGAAVEFGVLDFVFDTLGLSKLNCEVIEGNERMLKLQRNLFFEEEGFRKSNLIKNEKRIGVHLLGLQQAVWRENRPALWERYRDVFSRFDVKIHWTEETQLEASPIDRIEAARARNNLNWMSILRIALDRAPDTSRQIVSSIKSIDQEISALTKELLD